MKKYEITPCGACKGLGFILKSWYSQGTSGVDNQKCFMCKGSGSFIIITETFAATPEAIELHKNHLAQKL